ncbi:MAG: ImmA/IrrE family metallo-endopeptidase [Clostridiales bacterium]|nr:ImmA/IrrE family metallo-endopeptidase [Clostridiales bacterium]
MYKALDNSLFVKDKNKFDQLRERADGFNLNYNGSNIIQDDIFHVIENYTKKKGMPFEFLRYPIDDNDLCACTFVRGGRIFLLLNCNMALAKQIFAAGHELYHIWCYLEDEGQELLQKGSILASTTIDNSADEQEEMEANAFSGLLLVPADTLCQQIRIYGISASKINVTDIVMLMEIFAVPYKAMILRLYEESIVTEDQARSLFCITGEEINHQIELTGRAKRWLDKPKGVEKFGSLLENMTLNHENGFLQKSRFESDQRRIREIQKLYHLE